MDKCFFFTEFISKSWFTSGMTDIIARFTFKNVELCKVKVRVLNKRVRMNYDPEKRREVSQVLLPDDTDTA